MTRQNPPTDSKEADMTAFPITPGSTVRVPLHMLFVSPLNVRRNDQSDVTELAALIRSQSVLQNLLAVPEMDGADVTGYAIIGGGRRLRAMRLLEADGAIPADYAVPIQVVALEDAEQASLAENSGREPMHPADEFEAFKRQRDTGVPIEDIAAAFGVTPLVVRRRLKLASASPALLQAYRQGEMKLDQLQALAITDKHELQEKVWKSIKDGAYWQQSAHEIRAAITKGAVATATDHMARFVGLDAYEAAGGRVVRDLFSDRDDGYMEDADLLQKLFQEKIASIADQARAEGWSWVEVRDQVRSGEIYMMGKSKPTERPLTDNEQARLDELEAEAKQLRTKAGAVEDEDDSDEYEALAEQADECEAKIKAIKEGALTYSDRQKKKAGVIIGLNYNGQLEIHRGLLKETDKPKKAPDPGVTVTESGKAAHPESLVRKLSAHRTMALQASLADCHRLALDALCYSLATSVFYSGHYGAGGIQINAQPQTLNMKGHADEIEKSKAWAEMVERKTALQKLMPEDPAEFFGWVQAQALDTVMEILAFCTASCLTAVQFNEASRPLEQLEVTLGLDMADWWSATADSYFRHVRKETAIAAIKEADKTQDGAELAKMKKGELDQQAEKALAGTGWLPMILRAPDGAKKKAKPGKKETVTLSPEDWPFPTGKD